MASRKDNLRILINNPRSRVIIIFTASVLLLGLLVGYFKFFKNVSTDKTAAGLTRTPGNISSTPGALNQTAEYARLQNEQNNQNAQTALKQGTSAIPTIIDYKMLGNGVKNVGPKDGSAGVGFSTLANLDQGVQKPLWMNDLASRQCDKTSLAIAVKAGATMEQLKESCSCEKLKDYGFELKKLLTVCQCSQLRVLGFTALDFKNTGYSAEKVRICGFSACEAKGAGFSASDMKNGGFSDGEMKGAGFNSNQILATSGIPNGMSPMDIRSAGCSVDALKKLKAQGVTAAAIRRISGCDLAALKAAGYTANDLKDAGFTAAELAKAGFPLSDLIKAGFTPRELMDAGYSEKDLSGNGVKPDELLDASQTSGIPGGMSPNDIKSAECSVEALKKLKAQGISAATIRRVSGCDLAALKAAGYSASDLKDAGFTAAELAKAGFPLSDLIKAGFTPRELMDAGYSAKDLLSTGVSPADLLASGYKPEELLRAGVTPRQLFDAGLSAEELKKSGLDANALKAAGLSSSQLKSAGFDDSELGLPEKSDSLAKVAALNNTITSSLANVPNVEANKDKDIGLDNLKTALQEQKKQQAALRFQQKIQDTTTGMMSYSTQLISGWKDSPTQAYVAAQAKNKDAASSNMLMSASQRPFTKEGGEEESDKQPDLFIKTGDILFAVIDSAVNSDEPSPILATIVSGPLKGSKLIGSFNLPSNANKMIITFTTMSVKGMSKTMGVSAYAIDPNTGRTALSSSTNHHYLERYGALFASTFLEGFGNAFQSADTTITIGGTGGTGGPNSTTVQNGIGRSLTSNAVIGLATVGKAWGQQAQKNMNIPTTVQVYSGTPIGVLFLQDVSVNPNQIN